MTVNNLDNPIDNNSPNLLIILLIIIRAWTFETVTQQAVAVTNKAALVMSNWSPVTWDQDSLLRPGLKMTTRLTEGNSNLLGKA